MNARLCEISIIIKALNEAHNIERTIVSAIDAVRGLDGEVILADSLSTDATVAIAARYPVAIAQLLHAKDRCCGVGAQLGYQYATGDYVLIMDGDMVVDRDWLVSALQTLKSNSSLAGVGGLVVDVNLDNIEFRARQQRKPSDMSAGDVDRLDMGGLYRRVAIEEVGYLTHQGLHACEELELGIRLRAAGWKMARLDQISIHHYGHTDPMWQLIQKRWHSKYVNGAGELLRASFGKAWFVLAVRALSKRIVVVGWWAFLLFLLGSALLGYPMWIAFFICAISPPLLMTIKKRDFAMGFYSVLAWCIDAAGMLRGLLRAPKDPRQLVQSQLLKPWSGVS